MAKGYVLYNPKAGTGTDGDSIRLLDTMLEGEPVYLDITRVTNYRALLEGLEKEDYLVIAGGDGSLNRFINDTEGLNIPNEILYYPIGSGNDFARELHKNKGDAPFSVTRYLKDLPSVEVKGKTYRFLNGVGYGIDGYCCEVGDELRKIPGKKVNYTSIAIKGLLFHYKPTRATVTVDGVAHTYEKVWLAPTMNGKYYGGGMIPAPAQDRESSDKKLSVMLLHGAGKLKTLMVFPSIFKGEHVKYQGTVEVLEGREITVEFDYPRALQIDGETILNVSSYRAVSPACQKKTHRESAAAAV